MRPGGQRGFGRGQQRHDRLDAAIMGMAASSSFTPVQQLRPGGDPAGLRCLRATATLIAFELAVQIGTDMG